MKIFETMRKIASVASLLGIIILIFKIGEFKANSQSLQFDSTEQKEKVISHTTKGSDSYDNVHMTKEDKDKNYVTRPEFEMMLNYIEEIKQSQKTTEKDIKELLKRK